MHIFRRRPEVDAPLSPGASAHRHALIRDLTFEVVPMKSLAGAIEALPAHAAVSVTCSPAKGIGETQRITEDLLAAGHRPIPHISARLVRDRTHVHELASWFRTTGVDRIFVIAGDAPDAGAYEGAVEFLRDLLDADHGLKTVGVTAYPDGHAFLSDHTLHEALVTKQELFAQAGLAGYCSTQMCFDPSTIATWLGTARAAGIELPVHLGIPGVVDRTKLLTMGVRLGIGQSLSYLRKNKSAVAKLMTASDYDLDDLLVPLGEDLLAQGVTGLHVFTFNQVAATNAWRNEQLGVTTP